MTSQVNTTSHTALVTIGLSVPHELILASVLYVLLITQAAIDEAFTILFMDGTQQYVRIVAFLGNGSAQ